MGDQMTRQNICGVPTWKHGWLPVAMVFAVLVLVSVELQGQGFFVRPMRVEVSLAPGETVTRQLLIENRSEQDQIFVIQKADLAVDERGALKFLQFRTSHSSFGDRLSMSAEELLVEAGETGTITLTFSSPEDDDPQPRWGCLFVESAGPIGEVEIEEGASLGLKIRFAITLLQFDATKNEKSGGVTAMNSEISEPEEAESLREVVIYATFCNGCDNILKADARFEIRDVTGATLVQDEITDRWVLPRSQRAFSASFSAQDWLPGPYIALVIIDYGGETLTGGQLSFEIPKEE